MILPPFILLAYLIGSLPFAVWISKYIYKDDVRNHGSGNAGSTNMYRTFGVAAGLITQLLDIGKGALAAAFPILMGMKPNNQLSPEEIMLISLGFGLAAVVGHAYSVFLRFKGGKGVNTMLGMMLVISIWGSLVALAAFLVLLFLTRMVSVGSMGGVVAFNVYQWVDKPNGPYLLHIVGFLLLVFVVYTHRSNIQRILNGTENRIGRKANV